MNSSAQKFGIPQIRLAVTLTVLVLSASACRFGNRTSEPDTSTVSTDPITGYYETQAKTLTFCTEGATNRCIDTPLDKIPTFFKAAVTNPVGLLLDDSETGAGYIIASDGSGYNLPTGFASTASIQYQGATSPGTLWDDPACNTHIELSQTGSLSKTASASSSADGLPLTGALTLTMSLLQSFDGDCAPSLTAMEACMNDPTTCGGVDDEENVLYMQAVQEFFQPYLDSGVITSTDIPGLTTLSYEVTYE